MRAFYGFLGWLTAFVVWSVASEASADDTAGGDELPKLTFSNLVYRLDNASADFGFFKDDMRVLLLETLRNEGFRGMGAESLVFQRDDSSEADFALGGTVREAACTHETGGIRDCCTIGIDWELLDMTRQEVVYKHRSRYGECHLSGIDANHAGRRLAIGALRALLQRDRFVAELKQRKELQTDKPYAPAKLARCKPSKLAMAKDSDPALDATVIVQSGRGHGSGFILSSSGFIMTAAHVLQTNDVVVKTRDGVSYRAKPVRISRKLDVALLKAELTGALPDGKCLTVNPEQQRAGAEIYAIGAPASQELGFSLTRGIVSGLRERHGVHHLQTDAPVSPGNSGGPLVDDKGRVLAVVVSKLAGEALEGIAFGIPIDVATRALGLKLDAKSDAELENAPAIAITSDKNQAFVDPASPMPAPKRDQSRIFRANGASTGATLVKRRDPKQGFDVVQGWFPLTPGLEMFMLSAPTASKDRVAVRLRQKMGSDALKDCKSADVVLNGRPYAPLKVQAQTIKSGSREVVESIEAHYDISVFKRTREHAPTLQVRACGQSWLLAPTQLDTVQQLLSEHESVSGVPL